MQHRSLDAMPIDDIVKTAGVGKGSFFNHFGNKQNYADAIAENIREDLTGFFDDAIKGVSDPLLCLAIGMQKLTDFALTRRAKSIILLRAPVDLSLGSNARNETVASIMKACITYDYFRPEAKNMGVLYWHGLCAVLMTTITYVYEL